MEKKRQPVVATEGLPVHVMMKVHSSEGDLQKGLPPGAMQKLPPPPPPPPPQDGK